jgi:ParB-like chromosome segregation protein Spo0J
MDVVSRSGHRVESVAVESVEPNPFQPRREFAIEALNDLVESLRTHGLMQPIVVRKAKDRHEIVAGERRWRAAQKARVLQRSPPPCGVAPVPAKLPAWSRVDISILMNSTKF